MRITVFSACGLALAIFHASAKPQAADTGMRA
jgi:hypothetical protein